jgi:hypothetical protein
VDSTDGDAVAQSLAGRPEAFAAVVHRHGPAVHAYLVRRSDGQTADDLFGEVWLRAFRSRHSYNPQWHSARPWLYGIARNVLRAEWQRREPGCDRLTDPGHDPWHGYKVVNSRIQSPKGSFITTVLTPISTATSTALATVQLGRGEFAGPISFSPDGRVAYIGGAPVTAINLGTGTVSWTARSPVSGYAPLVSPDGRTIYAVGDSPAPMETPVYRIRAATGTLRGAVIPKLPGSAAFTEAAAEAVAHNARDFS